MNTDGSEKTRLTDTTNNNPPFFAHDDSKIIFEKLQFMKESVPETDALSPELQVRLGRSLIIAEIGI